MPIYTTTIEIHDATTPDYKALHEQLLTKSFKASSLNDTKISGKKTVKISYSISGDYSLIDVIETVKQAAGKLQKEFSFFVKKNKVINNALR